MKAEILMIGTELLLGQIVDTNASWLGQTLAEHGIHLYQKTTVGDNRERIVLAMRRALERSDVVLCSGGLGPTEDDITRDCVAEVFGVPMAFREELFNQVLSRFKHVRIKVTENNKKQATLPEGAVAIDNPRGTAPGLLMQGEAGTVICMPGVPHELKGMTRDFVLPWLREQYGLPGVLHYRVLKVCGVGESHIDHLMGDLINSHSNPTIGLLANPEANRIRIAAYADTLEQADRMIDAVDAKVRERLPGMVFGTNDDTIYSVVDALLQERGWTLGLVESVTGGLMAQRLLAHGARSLKGAVVYPPADLHTSPDTSFDDRALALATGYSVQCGADCVLAMLPDREQSRAFAVFTTPQGDAHWEMGQFASGERNQVRSAVYSFERMRRHLLGVEVDV